MAYLWISNERPLDYLLHGLEGCLPSEKQRVVEHRSTEPVTKGLQAFLNRPVAKATV